MKFCNHCKTSKSIADFARSGSSKDGKQYTCKTCSVVKMQEWKRLNPEKYREYNKKRALLTRLRHHGIALEEWLSLDTSECHICGAKTDKPHVDHDHNTGLVRGILCSNCNSGIGMLMDSAKVLRLAADYLDNPPLADRGWVSIAHKKPVAVEPHGWTESRADRQAKPKEPLHTSCPDCGGMMRKTSQKCRSCNSKTIDRSDRYGIDWPEYDDLVASVAAIGYSATGRNIGVSDNAVRKRIQRLESFES